MSSKLSKASPIRQRTWKQDFSVKKFLYLKVTYCINPITIQLWTLITIQCYHPATAVLVGLVFPHRPNVILEKRVIAPDFHFAWLLDVSEERPEVFDRVESWHLILIVFPWLIAVRLVIPQGPGMLQRMFDELSVCWVNLTVVTRILLLKRKRDRKRKLDDECNWNSTDWVTVFRHESNHKAVYFFQDHFSNDFCTFLSLIQLNLRISSLRNAFKRKWQKTMPMGARLHCKPLFSNW